ncbi:PBP2 [Candida pseudojiufengensis]|uniref:PBP2 n=1 Tax=Candida pseudojiufengensis TaxID=497109 RepID=UPI002224E3F7|nr:PBP2 [Candida pseudojiufengensis]KAI5963229.1 PBP2 [Candida pseudojiufengensis]
MSELDSHQLETSNGLKRKNEEVDDSTDRNNEDDNNLNDASSHTSKRVALDSEQIQSAVKTENENEELAPTIGNTVEKEEAADEEERTVEESANQGSQESEQLTKVKEEANEDDIEKTLKSLQNSVFPNDSSSQTNNNLSSDNANSQSAVEAFLEQAGLASSTAIQPQQHQQPQHQQPQHQQSFEQDYESSSTSSKPVSSHLKEKDSDISFRMLCPVKEASTIVGKQGSKINHLREKAAVRIQVSDNLKGIPERITTVKGTPENVARAFGLIVRTILNEDEDEPANMRSQQYNLKLLIPHPLIGFIIGKQGSKFREIEENSAAKLKAAETPLPYSTDRILSVVGVADAIHIAVYYIAQIVNDHRDVLKKNKVILYNTANYQQTDPFGDPSHQQQQQHQQPRYPQQSPYGGGANTVPIGGGSYQNPSPFQPQQSPPQPPQYNFQSMFQPAMPPQQQYGGMGQIGGISSNLPPSSISSSNIPPQSQYTDEYGNTMIGEVIVHQPVQTGDKFNQDVFVANSSIGSVIGKGGNNIKHIRENSGCTYVKIEPDRGQSIMLGSGRGLTNIRRLTLTGSLDSFQKAIYLINQRINADRERNTR